MITSKHRGHAIVCKGRHTWVYADTGNLVSEESWRPCGHCGKLRTPEGHDGCLGTLPGVANACCGHGSPLEAYVQFTGGKRLAGVAALRAMTSIQMGFESYD